MIAIVKYNAGNIRSVQNALNRMGCNSIITDDPTTIKKANKVILPGVGQASAALQYLKEKQLDVVIRSLTQPCLGICLGLQLMCSHSEEGDTPGLEIFKTTVKLFAAKDKVPHMGWNNSTTLEGVLFDNIGQLDNFYYVHSYYAELCHETVATCDYILPFSAALQKDNFYATQFHPEKSSKVGEQLLENFLKI